MSEFAQLNPAERILMGLGLNDDNLHAPNEKMELDNFFRGNEAAAYLQEELGAMTFTSNRRSGGKPAKRNRR